MSDDFLSSFVRTMHATQGIPPEIILSLHKDDDWSFVIKLCALVEIYLTAAMIRGLNDPPVEKLLTEQGLERKIQICCAKNIITDECRKRFIFLLGIRNKLAAHKLTFSFDEYFANKDNLNGFKGSFKDSWVDPMQLGDKKIPAAQFVEENPKLTLYFDIIYRLSDADLGMELDELRKKREELEQANAFFDLFNQVKSPK